MTPDSVRGFYDSLAASYHLLFEDWTAASERQGATLHRLLTGAESDRKLRLLDFSCGIGTQALGLARMGHQVTGSDLSEAAIVRARAEAKRLRLMTTFYQADMTRLDAVREHNFDVACAFDNALPHLSAGQLPLALSGCLAKLKAGGLFAASLRDYDRLILERPTMQPPAFFGEGESRRFVHQVWEWLDASRYTVHLYLTRRQEDGEWICSHFACEYRCLQRDELEQELARAGFDEIRWHMPQESGYYQPIVTARLPPTTAA